MGLVLYVLLSTSAMSSSSRSLNAVVLVTNLLTPSFKFRLLSLVESSVVWIIHRQQLLEDFGANF